MSHYYIMNASSLFNNKAASIGSISEEWADGEYTVLVARREIGYIRDSKIFIVGSGFGYEKVPEAGSAYIQLYTQDTGNGYTNKGRTLRVDNVITIKDGYLLDPGNGLGLNEKRRVWVMK